MRRRVGRVHRMGARWLAGSGGDGGPRLCQLALPATPGVARLALALHLPRNHCRPSELLLTL